MHTLKNTKRKPVWRTKCSAEDLAKAEALIAARKAAR